MRNVDDVRDFDAMLRKRVEGFREKLADWLAPHRLTLAEVRTHRVLIPMEGVYTPGWQALPACSWAFVELVTKEGLVGTGEYSIGLPEQTRSCIETLRASPEANLLDLKWEEPLFMAWWDLVGQVLNKPLHELWAELFERSFAPPSRVPTAAYTWNRFPDASGHGEVTYDTWPAHAAARVKQGFTAIKVSMTGYQPRDYIDLVHRIREAIGPDIALRIDAHGTWNYQEARTILPQLEDCNLEYIEQPVNSLLPQCYYPASATVPKQRSSDSQYAYYFRQMTELRRHIRTPLSCHWWTPPIVLEPGATMMSNRWEPDWYLLERYDAADISVPDIGLGVWGLWRTAQLARFLGMHITVHSNFELCLQLQFRSAMVSALVYDIESAGLYLGSTPRSCHAIDNETIQVSDDVIEGGQFKWTDGHISLPESPGHGVRLDPDRLQCYRYSEAAVAPHRAYAAQLYGNYQLDRPWRISQSGWPKSTPNEVFQRHAYPYDLGSILQADEAQQVDIKLNM